MAENPTYSLAQVIALAKGTTNWYEYAKSGAQHGKNNQDDISALSGGGAPGWQAAIDLRWYVADTSSSTTTYTGVTKPTATGSDSLFAGYFIIFKPATNNTGASTLNVASSDGAVDIKKISSGAKAALAAGDLDSDTYAELIFDGTDWIMLNAPVSAPITALNSATENELVTVGATTTELDAEANLTFDGTDLTIGAGDIVFGTAGKGICLGVTSNTDANTLDDYEEGVATMTCAAYSGTITMNTASDLLSYVKIGRLVFIQGEFTFSTATDPATSFLIYGLPFTAVALSEGAGGGHINSLLRNANSECVGLKFYIPNGHTTLYGREDGRTNDGSLCANYLDTGSYLSISGSYYASA